MKCIYSKTNKEVKLMKFEMYQVVRLKTGEKGTIIEVFNDGEGYMVDIRLDDYNYEQRTVLPTDIESVFEEIKRKVAIA